jgi:vancomycin permeability regulator SanA
MRRRFTKSLLLAVAMLAVVVVATAFAYLHVANAQSYAVNHVRVHNCPNLGGCSAVWATGYNRISDNRVDVTVAANTYGHGRCDRLLIVRGNDGSEYIDGGGLFTCQR